MTQIRDDIHPIDVLVRATDEQRVSLADLGDLAIPVPDGRTVPWSQVARLEIGQGFPLVWRRDRLASLTVQADHVPGVLPAEVVESSAPSIERARVQLPEVTGSRSAARSRRAPPRRPRCSTWSRR